MSTRSRRAALGPGLWVPAGLAALVMLLLREFLFGGGVFYRRDVHLVWHPQVEAFVRAVTAGSWPLWDPSPGFGQPLLADPSAQILYPFTWLNLVLKPWTYYTVFVAAHACFSAWGMALLARRHGLAPLACFTAAALWVTSGPFVSLFDLWHHYAGACWIPWVALAAHRAFDSRRGRDYLLLGTVTGLQLLAGSADMVMLTALFLAVHVVVLHVGWRRSAMRDNLRLLAAGAGAGAIAIALSAGLWLTAAAAARGTDRFALPEAVRTYWSVHPLGMLETVFPGLWTTLPLSEPWRAALYESREPFLGSLYLGLGTWALALSSLSLSASRDRRPLVLVGTAAIALLLALGRHAPFYAVAVAALPPLGMLRYPVKAMVLGAFALCLAAGHGLDGWHRGRAADRRPWPALVFLALVAVANVAMAAAIHAAPSEIALRVLGPSPEAVDALAGRMPAMVVGSLLSAGWLASILRGRGRRAATAAAVAAGLAVAELAVYHRHANPTAPVSLYTHRPEAVDLLRRERLPRVYAYDYSLREVDRTPPPLTAVPAGWSVPEALALAQQMSLTPAAPGRWDLDSGWDIDYRGLYPRWLAQLAIALRKAEGTPLLLRLLRMGAVTHVVALHEQGFQDLVPIASLPSLRAGPVRVFTVPGTLPRTYAVGTVHHAAELAAVERILASDFDPAREVILDDPAAPSTSAGPVGESRLTLRRPDRVRIEADMSAPGYVVLVEGFSAGWRATVDGRPAPILRANLAFRAVAVPAGRHALEMVYRPPAALIGLALSALTAAACAVALTRGRQR